MKHYLRTVFILATITLLAAITVQADNDQKMVIALQTDNFELAETDISDMVVGEAKTIETESGKVIDILRTTDGAEIYIDGQLLELGLEDKGLHVNEKHIEIICDEDEECDRHVVIHAAGDGDVSEWIGEHGDKVIIKKEIELSCTDDEEGTSCSDTMMWVSDGDDVDLEELHREHVDGESHKVIVIKTRTDSEN